MNIEELKKEISVLKNNKFIKVNEFVVKVDEEIKSKEEELRNFIEETKNEERKNYNETTTTVGTLTYIQTSSYFDTDKVEELLLKKIENKTVELSQEKILEVLKILEND